MSRISFVRFDNDGESVELKINGDKTWPEVTESFIYFLRGCGYQVTFEDVRDYLVELCGDDVANEMNDWDTDNLSWLKNWDSNISSSIVTDTITDSVTCSVTSPTIPTYSFDNSDVKITLNGSNT